MQLLRPDSLWFASKVLLPSFDAIIDHAMFRFVLFVITLKRPASKSASSPLEASEAPRML